MDDLKSIADYEGQFEKIADCLMNDHVLVCNKDFYYRISEIEFYFNDLKDGKLSVHPDTFTHGDEM